MPTEVSRTTKRKTVVLPNDETIEIPVITKISFLDPNDRAQETQHTIDNSREESSRSVHVDEVHPVDVDEDGVPTEESPEAGTDSLYVERIDTWRSIDPNDRGQETHTTLDNTTGNDLLPPHFTAHVKTHIYRYHQDPENPDDNGVWIDSELIDEFAVIDPSERGQESHYYLNNPTNAEFRDGDLSGQAADDDADITIPGGDGEGTEDNPIRLDPFQNIVNYSGTPLYIGLSVGALLSGVTTTSAQTCGLPEPPGSPHTGDGGIQTYQISANCNVSYGATVPLADISGLPSLPADFNAGYGFFESAPYIHAFPDSNQGNLHVTNSGLSCTYTITRDPIVESVFCNEISLYQAMVSFTQEEIHSQSFSLPSSFVYKGKTYTLAGTTFTPGVSKGLLGSYQREDPT